MAFAAHPPHPRELRDQIYEAYLFIDTEYGFVLDFEAGKLRAARAPPIGELGYAYGRDQASLLTLCPLRLLTSACLLPAPSSAHSAQLDVSPANCAVPPYAYTPSPVSRPTRTNSAEEPVVGTF